MVGLVMIFFQIILGGITRLTGSGLSITKWDIVTGIVPPISEAGWIKEFDLYRQSPQYQKINQGMSLGQFKWIFFWEYIHRLWARSMGFVFLIPFFIFWRKGYLKNKDLQKDLWIVFVLAGIVGLFGWIMVASGLVNRPWVNAYKLSLHLGLALITLSYLWYVYLKYTMKNYYTLSSKDASVSKWLLFLVSIQILLGGMMSGMKAALVYPTFPKMGNYWIDPVLLQVDNWKLSHLVDYDSFSFAPALVQVLHRSMAFLILVLFMIKLFKHLGKIEIKWLGLVLIIQIALGIFTLIGSVGYIPVALGVFHQCTGIFLLILVIKWWFVNHPYLKILS